MHTGASAPQFLGHVSERKNSSVVPFGNIKGAGLSMPVVHEPGGNVTNTPVLLFHGVQGPLSEGAVCTKASRWPGGARSGAKGAPAAGGAGGPPPATASLELKQGAHDFGSIAPLPRCQSRYSPVGGSRVMYAPWLHGGTTSCWSRPAANAKGPTGEGDTACATEDLLVQEARDAWSHIKDAKRW